MSLRRTAATPGGFTTFRPKKPKPSRRSLDPVAPEVYDLVFARDGGCLLRGSTGAEFAVACAGRHQWCHRLAVAYGGHATPDNGWRGCVLHHARTERYRKAARELGLFLYRGEDPSRVPVRLNDGRLVLLRNDGTTEDVT